jgi:hypothetical protein
LFTWPKDCFKMVNQQGFAGNFNGQGGGGHAQGAI